MPRRLSPTRLSPMTSIQRVTHDPDWYEPYRISLAVRALLQVAGLAQPDWLIEIGAIALDRRAPTG